MREGMLMGFRFKLLFLLMFFLPISVALGAEGRIEAIGGADSVLVKRDAKELQLKKGEELLAGDELVTDKKTSVDIRLQDDSLIRVGANSAYKMVEDSKARQIWHRLLNGIVRVLVPSKKDKDGNVRFRMSTPEGTIGVRGTEFVVIRENGETKLRGLSGEVLFGPVDTAFESADFVPVKKGFESLIKSGQKKPLAPKEFPLQQYLKELDSKTSGPFASLASRSQERMRMRADKPAATVASSPSVPAAPRVEPKNIGEPVKKAPVKAEGPSMDWNALLMTGVAKGSLDTVNQAIKGGANVNQEDADGDTPLHIAAGNSQRVIIQALVDAGAQIDRQNRKGLTPLHVAVLQNARLSTVETLLANGASVFVKSFQGRTPVDMAKSADGANRNAEVIRLLEQFSNAKK